MSWKQLMGIQIHGKLIGTTLLVLLTAGGAGKVQANTSPLSTGNLQQLSNLNQTEGETLTASDIEQTITGLELIASLDITPSQRKKLDQLKTEVQNLITKQSSPYELPATLRAKLNQILANLSQTQLQAINSLLLTRKTEESLSLKPEQISSLRQFIEAVSKQQESNLKKEKLAFILDWLQQLPNDEVISFSAEETETLKNAIASGFSIPEKVTEPSSTETSESKVNVIANST